MTEVSTQRSVVLKCDNVHLSFGAVVALDAFNTHVLEHEILAIIGPNGAGKTSLLNCINGYYRPQKGTIYFDGQPITKLPTYKVAELGIARTFQNIELFTGLTTLENLMAARHAILRPNILACAIYFGREHRRDIADRKVGHDSARLRPRHMNMSDTDIQDIIVLNTP